MEPSEIGTCRHGSAGDGPHEDKDGPGISRALMHRLQLCHYAVYPPSI